MVVGVEGVCSTHVMYVWYVVNTGSTYIHDPYGKNALISSPAILDDTRARPPLMALHTYMYRIYLVGTHPISRSKVHSSCNIHVPVPVCSTCMYVCTCMCVHMYRTKFNMYMYITCNLLTVGFF